MNITLLSDRPSLSSWMSSSLHIPQWQSARSPVFSQMPHWLSDRILRQRCILDVSGKVPLVTIHWRVYPDVRVLFFSLASLMRVDTPPEILRTSPASARYSQYF